MANDSNNPAGKPQRAKSLTPVLIFATLAVAVLAYAVYGITHDDFVMPYSWSRPGDAIARRAYVHFHGGQAWVLFAAAMAIVAGCLTHIAQHLDLLGKASALRAVGNAALVGGTAVAAIMTFLRYYGAI